MTTSKLRVIPRHQRGAIILVMALLLGILLPVLLAAADKQRQAGANRQARSLRALVAARDVLIARAVKGRRDEFSPSETPQFRPGSLPCPDVNNDGSADGSNCENYVGRLPYKTLETDDLRDASGERLWYVLSPNFRPGLYPTSNTEGQLALSGAMHLRQVVALLIAPGGVVGNQSRGCDDQKDKNECRALNVANYLEGKNAHLIDTVAPLANEAVFEAWSADSQRNPPFNDTVIAITSDMFMPQVEHRIAREALACLDAYANSNNQRFPWPTSQSQVEQTGTRFGRFPVAAAFAPTEKICRGSFPYAYFDAWRSLIFYGVAQAHVAHLADSASDSTGSYLTVNGDSSVKAVVILPGRPLESEGQTLSARQSAEADTRQFLEADPNNLLRHNWQVSATAPMDRYVRTRPATTGARQFNDTLECLSDNKSGACVN